MPETRTAKELADVAAKLTGVKSANQKADIAQRTAEARQGELAEAVRTARAAGASWSEVGLTVGMTRQAAFKRWRWTELGDDA